MDYCSKEDIFNVFGRNNVRKWADLDNTQEESTIESNIARAITTASAYIDSILKTSRYRLPLQDINEDVPTMVVELAATKAGVLLYEGRGVQEWNDVTGQPQHRLGFQRQAVAKQLFAIRGGFLAIGAVLNNGMNRPEVV